MFKFALKIVLKLSLIQGCHAKICIFSLTFQDFELFSLTLTFLLGMRFKYAYFDKYGF